MHKTSNAPAGSGEGAAGCQLRGDSSQINSCGGEAQARPVYILPFPGRTPQCEHCGWLVPPASATKLRHYYLCTLPRQKAEARARRLERARAEWRATATEAPRRVSIGPRRPDAPAPLPPPRPSAWHREQLQAALCYPEMHERLDALTRLPLAARRWGRPHGGG